MCKAFVQLFTVVLVSLGLTRQLGNSPNITLRDVYSCIGQFGTSVVKLVSMWYFVLFSAGYVTLACAAGPQSIDSRYLEMTREHRVDVRPHGL